MSGTGVRRYRTAHELVRETLRQAILGGVLPGGTRLVQAELAEQLNVSTTPVREALRDLAAERLISLDRHRGGTVLTLQVADVEELSIIRTQLDQVVAPYMARGLKPSDLSRAESLCDEMESDQISISRWVELNRHFHEIFYDAMAMPRLASILKSLEDAAATFVIQAQYVDPHVVTGGNSDHREMIAGFREGRLDDVTAVLLGHQRGLAQRERPTSELSDL